MKNNNLKEELLNNEEILKLVQDKVFAQNLYAALAHIEWIKNKDKYNSCCYSWKEAGEIVAELRNKTLGTREDYKMWWSSGSRHPCSNTCKLVPEGTITERIKELLEKMNWTVNFKL